MRRNWWIALGAGMAVLAGGVTTAASRDDPLEARPLELSVPVDQPTLRPKVRAEVVIPTTTAGPVLPVPQAPPEDPYADEPVVEQGRLSVPRLGLDVPYYEGMSLTVIDNGPSHWPGTATPGQLGNVVIAGHRVTHTRPFRNLDQLQHGDLAVFTTPDGVFTYEFTGHDIVTPDQIEIIHQTAEHRATFFACHPPGSARERIVAYWRLVDPPPAAPTS